MIAAFISGILFAWYKVPFVYPALISVMGCLLVYLLMFRLKRHINRRDWFLWGLPFLIFLGFFSMKDRMKPPDIDAVFEEKSECSLTGKIGIIVKKPWGTAYYLKNNRITLPDNKTYFVEEVVVNEYEIPSSNKNISNQVFSNQYRVGNTILVSGTIIKFRTGTNPGEFNEYLYYKSQNISYKVSAKDITVIDGNYSFFRNALSVAKEKLADTYGKILPEKEAGIVMAMVLGEKYMLDEEVKTLYQKNGISHILAISGLHVSMAGAAIYFLFKKLGLGIHASTIISMAFVYCYGILTNFSVSTNRAVVMYFILLLAGLVGRTFDILSALSLSAFIILLQNPYELFQAGFLLSFGAVLGIAVLLPCLNSMHGTKNGLVKGLYTSISAQVLTLPAVLYYFFQVPLYGVLVNLLVVPLTSLLMLAAAAAGMVGVISSSLGIFLAGGANYILKIYEAVCKVGSKLPGNTITVGRSGFVRILLYYGMVTLFIICSRRIRKLRVLLILAAAVAVLTVQMPDKKLHITMLDVGQGDAIFIRNGSGGTYLVDGGSQDVNRAGSCRITPYLLSIGVDTLDYAIVTHTDKDHVSGLMELIEEGRVTVKHLILPETNTRNRTYAKLEEMARGKKIKLVYMASGDRITDGNLIMHVLHPPIGYQPSSGNDYSMVLSISYGDFDMLLTGDIEAKGEGMLVEFFKEREMINSRISNPAAFVQTDYDVLKVSHHGSRNSTSEVLLSIIKPEYALISCGRGNSYGHPHAELIERLVKSGSEVYITYETGAVSLITDGLRLRIRRHLKDI